jgi:hypothetical protein
MRKKFDLKTLMDREHSGTRYLVDYDVIVEYSTSEGKKVRCKSVGKDISSTGMLLAVPEAVAPALEKAGKMVLFFEIAEGTMPEGYEMKVEIEAEVVRRQPAADGKESLSASTSRKASPNMRAKRRGATFPPFLWRCCFWLRRSSF